MKKLALFLYKRVCIRNLPLFRGDSVGADLAILHPEERQECVKTEYYVKKLSLCLTILFAGILLGGLVKLQQIMNPPLGENGEIRRGSFQEGEKQILLEADSESGKEEFQVTVFPTELSLEELEQFAERFLENCSEMILNGNADVEHISEPLALSDSYEGYPFEVSWESGSRDILDDSGAVTEPQKATEAELFVTLLYGEYSRTERLTLTVVPRVLSPEEQAHLELEEYLLKSEKDSRGQGIWNLPDSWKGSTVVWSLKERKSWLIIWLITPIVCLLVYFSSDRDIHREVELRQKKMRQQYPELVHKLALYIGAGMTIRGAFQKIGSDYERKTNRPRDENIVGKEVLYTCRELQSGIAEGAAYERFGRRTGLREYIKLSALLGQNLKRGNRTLLERLREEAEKTSEESILQAKKLGEEAGTKLLIPMVIMLGIVMVMIMIPAFGSI